MNADRLLTIRVLVPVAGLFLLIDYLDNGLVGGLMFILTQLNVGIPAIVFSRRHKHLRGLSLLMVAAEVVLIGTSIELVRGGDYTVGTFGLACFVISQLMFGATAVWLVSIKKPNQSRDGLLDAGAALIGVTALTWQVQAASTRPDTEDLKPLLFIILGFIMLAILPVVGRLISRNDHAKRPILAMVGSCLFLSICVPLTGSYSNPNPPLGAFAAGNIAAFLLGATLLHSRFAAFCTPDTNEHVKLSVIRWLGPASALVVTPVMFTLLFTHEQVPSFPVVAAAILLTVVTTWRITRLFRQRHTSRVALLSSEQRFTVLVEHSADVIAVIDSNYCISYVSGGFDAMTGSSADEVLGNRIAELLEDDQVAALTSALASATDQGVPVPVGGDLHLRNTAGHETWVSMLVTNHLDNPTINGWVINLHEVTERKKAEDALFGLALHDTLTGLPNRARMLQLLEQSISTHPGRTTLLFCDLDGFKAVNDSLGHDAGDEVLRVVAARWSAVLRSGDALGRWGGDEFVMLCPGLTSNDDHSSVSQRLLDALESPIQIGSHEARVGSSVGLAVHRQGESPEDFIHRADAAMYEIKHGRHAVN